MRRNVVWIVEMKGNGVSWTPCVGVALNRDDARAVLLEWKKRNPSDRFRLAQYVVA